MKQQAAAERYPSWQYRELEVSTDESGPFVPDRVGKGWEFVGLVPKRKPSGWRLVAVVRRPVKERAQRKVTV